MTDATGASRKGRWPSRHPFLLFGFASLVVVLLVSMADADPYSPAGIATRTLIAPMYAGVSVLASITRMVPVTSAFSPGTAFLLQCLMIPLSMAPYVGMDLLLAKTRRASSRP